MLAEAQLFDVQRETFDALNKRPTITDVTLVSVWSKM
jgi:hypothetical protein